MAEHAVRAFAVAGVFATVVLCGGVTAAPVLADPDGGSDGSSQSSGGTDSGGGSASTGGSDTGSSSASSGSESSTPDRAEEKPAPEPDPEPAIVRATPEVSTGDSGGGSSDSGSKSAATVDVPPPPKEIKKSEYGSSISVPFLRLPGPGEIPAGSWPTASTFYSTVQIPVPSLRDFLVALRIIPAPPPPGPAFRTQEESPVADSTTGTAGGILPGPSGGGSGSPVFRAPLVVSVPRAVTIAAGAPRTAPAEAGVTAPGMAGVRTPVIRGSVEPTPGVTAEPSAPVPMAAGPGAPAAAVGAPRPTGLPRVTLSPTLAEIAAVALPGVAGLAFLTFGGGVVGYRQANSLRYVRTAGAERFLP